MAKLSGEEIAVNKDLTKRISDLGGTITPRGEVTVNSLRAAEAIESLTNSGIAVLGVEVMQVYRQGLVTQSI